jgi:hypothetical protein
MRHKMNNEDKTIQKLQEEDLIREYQGKTDADSESTIDFGSEEPWAPIETQMVIGSLVGGLIALVVLAFLVHVFILRGL